MNGLKRVGIFLVAFAVAVLFSVSYKGNDILQRAIILGVGVDAADDGVSVTCEVVSPGNGGEQVGMFSKTISANGKTVAEGLQKISEKAGKEASLGQCVLLVYGEELARRGFSDEAEFFIKSDSFRESATVCCCQGSAQSLLNKGDAISQSISLALADKLKGLAKEVAIPSNDLLSFTRSQRELYQTGFLNYVQFAESQNTNSDNPSQQQGFFLCDKIAVFRQNKLVGILSEQETAGFAVVSSKVLGNTFTVTAQDGKLMTLRVNGKNVDLKEVNGNVEFSVKLQVKPARTDSFGAGGNFTAKTETVPQDMLDQARKNATSVALLFLQKQQEWDFDLTNVHEAFRQKYGTTLEVTEKSMRDVEIKLSVTVLEK